MNNNFQIFYRWLKIEGYYEIFIYNVLKFNMLPSQVITLINKRHVSDIVNDLFDWDETYEGFEFWSDVDDEWNDWIMERLDSNGKFLGFNFANWK